MRHRLQTTQQGRKGGGCDGARLATLASTPPPPPPPPHAPKPLATRLRWSARKHPPFYVEQTAGIAGKLVGADGAQQRDSCGENNHLTIHGVWHRLNETSR